MAQANLDEVAQAHAYTAGIRVRPASAPRSHHRYAAPASSCEARPRQCELPAGAERSLLRLCHCQSLRLGLRSSFHDSYRRLAHHGRSGRDYHPEPGLRASGRVHRLAHERRGAVIALQRRRTVF